MRKNKQVVIHRVTILRGASLPLSHDTLAIAVYYKYARTTIANP